MFNVVSQPDSTLPLLPRNMADKRRSGVMSDSKPATKAETDQEFLSQAGVGVLLRGALLKLVEARSEDPIGFLAEHFSNLASETDNGPVGVGDGEHHCNVLEQQQLSRALWHIGLAHHSQRSAFNSNTRVAYDLLMQNGPRRRGAGGVKGRVYTELLRGLCSEGGLSVTASAPLLQRIHCHDHEAVPFELFRQGVLTCAVFTDYIRKSQCLYAAVSSSPERAADRALCQAVLGTLQEALETTSAWADVAHYLEASMKISPGKLAQAMAEAQGPDRAGTGSTMDAQEFEDTAAKLFLARVRIVS
ncbi:tubulin polyglutamylase complex subunit 1 [Sardina pilchardus]|uniref:tubulin polyglutamylase complex subunit 1 n=1 Tax=Sardina pilchardus TaxID=27697 RepID=UPI002E1487C3